MKHTRYSAAKITSARDALAVVNSFGEDFPRELQILANTSVTDDQWRTFVDRSVPLDDAKGHLLEGRSRTLALRKRGELEHLYRKTRGQPPGRGPLSVSSRPRTRGLITSRPVVVRADRRGIS